MTSKKCRKIFAIVSDYDGTLAPTSAIRTKGKDRIPENLEKLLLEISQQIPVCILSSKDYIFLRDKVPFANIISCILGTETVVVDRDNDNPYSDITKILSRHLLVDKDDLPGSNDRTLNHLADDIALQFPEIEVERKFTLDNLLVGITFDWRNRTEDWNKYSGLVPAYVKDLLSREPYSLTSTTLNLLSYKSHPFMDLYAVECDKGMGFDCILEELSYHSAMGSILYLGDSENDNPAFQKAGISVGVISDSKLDSDQLRCDYLIGYSQMANFLELLMDDEFVFSSSIMRMLTNSSVWKTVQK